MANVSSKNKSSYLDQPCERCGSPKKILKTWEEEMKTSLGSTTIIVSQSICTNKACQDLFDKNRAEDLVKIDQRKEAKEKQDQIRRDNIAHTISERRKNKVDLKLTKKTE